MPQSFKNFAPIRVGLTTHINTKINIYNHRTVRILFGGIISSLTGMKQLGKQNVTWNFEIIGPGSLRAPHMVAFPSLGGHC